MTGFECLLVKDATDGYVEQERKAIVVDMITLSQVRFIHTIPVQIYDYFLQGPLWLCVRLSIPNCCSSALHCRNSNEETQSLEWIHGHRNPQISLC